MEGLGQVYYVIAWIVGVITAIICWIYCISQYGFLIGVGIGWLPSAIAGFVIGLLWPVLVIGLLLPLYLLQLSL